MNDWLAVGDYASSCLLLPVPSDQTLKELPVRDLQRLPPLPPVFRRGRGRVVGDQLVIRSMGNESLIAHSIKTSW